MSDRVTIAVFDEASGWRLSDEIVETIRSGVGDAWSVRTAGSRYELEDALPDSDALVGFPITAQQLESEAPGVRFVQLTDSIGDAARPLVAALERGVRVASAASMRAPQLAEHAVAMLLAMNRAIVDASLAQSQHRWATRELADRCRTLRGARVGVFGPAAIRDAIRARLSGFEAEAVGLGDDGRAGEPCTPLAQLTGSLAQLDALIIAAPLTPRTRRVIGKRALGVMASHAVIVDVSRGGVLDQAALLEALRRRRIAGAALDGFETRPLPPTSPMWTMPNVLVSPGIAGARPDYWTQAAGVIVRNLKAFKAGEALVDEVEPGWYAAAARA